MDVHITHHKCGNLAYSFQKVTIFVCTTTDLHMDFSCRLRHVYLAVLV
jgi:hypothetical protein